METAEINEIFKAIPHLKKTGIQHLWFDFDEEADVLYINLERPQQANDTDIMEDNVFLRMRDNKLVGITITNVSKKFESLK